MLQLARLPENRCLVPLQRFAGYAPEPKPTVRASRHGPINELVTSRCHHYI